jgi:hypothetical protein
MYWFLAKFCILVCAPLPIGARITRPDPTKNEWVFTCREWKAPWQLAREFYLEQKEAYKVE